jgi:hypothetical protein
MMLKAGDDEDLAREWVSTSHLYGIRLLGFQYYVGLYTHLWKVPTSYSWHRAELQMEQHVKEMRQIRQSHGTRLQVVCLTYIYSRDQRDKGFLSCKIEDKMNKEICSEMETSKGENSATGGGVNLSRLWASIVVCQGSTREGRSFFSGKNSPKLKQEKNG